QYARNSDRLVSVTHPDGSRECQSWDDRGRLITQSDALENTTLYHYPDGEATLTAAGWRLSTRAASCAACCCRAAASGTASGTATGDC
ncbi:hypothetical protein ACMFMH_17680, partial [Erwinia amylovora]|uniref:hypothetical protein n=1 Tax=Erwinia amylovora TaxID=552 RepID=UPI0039BCADC5